MNAMLWAIGAGEQRILLIILVLVFPTAPAVNAAGIRSAAPSGVGSVALGNTVMIASANLVLLQQLTVRVEMMGVLLTRDYAL